MATVMAERRSVEVLTAMVDVMGNT